MKCLAIDTTKTDLIALLVNNDKVDSIVKEIGKSGHSAALMPTIDELLTKNKVDISEIDTVACVVGPGSFTGIRIGVSCITAIAFANNAKRIRITSFELQKNKKDGILTIDAGHGNLYAASVLNGNIVDNFYIEAEEVKNYNPSKFFNVDEKIDINYFSDLIKEKYQNNDFVSVLEPYYMRKSQAEREKDEI